MSVVWLGCIVEGDGEVSALPVLVRRIAALIDPGLYVRVPAPVRVKRHQVVQAGHLERAVALVVRQIRPPCAILVLLDADDDDAAPLTAELLARVRAARGDVPSSVVVAVREYEAWFLAAAESLRGHRGLPPDLAPPPDPEAVGGAKGWLRRHMPGGRKYAETSDQAALTELFDMELARSRSPSFDRCYREIDHLLRSLLPPAPPEGGNPAGQGE